LEPRLAEAQAGRRAVFFMDAAHFVFAPFLGIVWCWQRVFVTAPSGRQRLNVLAALNAMTQELCTVENLTSITAETGCELLHRLAGGHQGIPITIILDNARYQRCALVQAVAQELGIELLYLPTYSPNLNLIERFWRFVKKPCLYSKYYADRTAFQQAIRTCIQQAPTTHQEELEQLLSLRFQTFQDVPVIGDQQTISKRSKKKVLSKAA
jgi:transposase